MDWWEIPTAYLCKPHPGGESKVEACFNGESGKLGGHAFPRWWFWEESTWGSSMESPESFMGKGKGKKWVLLPRRSPSLCRQPESWSKREAYSKMCTDIPFTSLWSVWVNMRIDFAEFLGYSLPLSQSLWQCVTSDPLCALFTDSPLPPRASDENEWLFSLVLSCRILDH